MLTGFSIFGHKCKFRNRIIGIDSSNELRRIEKIFPFDEKADGFINPQSKFDNESRRRIAH
jgi:hypothetical protein